MTARDKGETWTECYSQGQSEIFGLRVTGGARVKSGLNVTARNKVDIRIESDRRTKGEIGTKCFSQEHG